MLFKHILKAAVVQQTETYYIYLAHHSQAWENKEMCFQQVTEVILHLHSPVMPN